MHSQFQCQEVPSEHNKNILVASRACELPACQKRRDVQIHSLQRALCLRSFLDSGCMAKGFEEAHNNSATLATAKDHQPSMYLPVFSISGFPTIDEVDRI